MEQQVLLDDPLISTILLFGRSLRKLCIRDCRMHDATVFHLLQQLPRLTHLTFLAPDMAERHILGPEHLLPAPAEEDQENEDPPDNLFPGLVYLHLDSYRSSIIGVFRARLLPFLIRCPNLQCLITSTPHRAQQQNSFYSCMFISRCPKLRYLAWGVPRWLYDTKYPAPDNALPACTETSIKQRYKAINDEFGNAPLAQNLTGPSLDAFTIYGNYNSLQATRNQGTDQFLRRFCQHIKILDASINNMDLLYLETVNEALNSFADNQLRYLRVNNMISNDRRRYTVCDFSALARIQHLRYLCFKNVVILQQNLEVIGLGLRELNEFHLHFDDPDRLALHSLKVAYFYLLRTLEKTKRWKD
ncbi:hypothetical protein BJV82DRAFT_667889 [Fennellomyces sp. T-0311]|nr:hypothetical protein BJV82DRAFT_667889 [Fennellomyces sp. T-0311]